MKLELRFETGHNFLPTDYRPYFMSYIKSALQHSNKEIYDDVYGKQNIKSKVFTYALVTQNSKITRDIIILKTNEFKILFSSYDHAFILYLYNAFMKNRNITKHFNKDFSVTLRQVYITPLPNIKENQININFLSPLLVRQHDKESNKDT